MTVHQISIWYNLLIPFDIWMRVVAFDISGVTLPIQWCRKWCFFYVYFHNAFRYQGRHITRRRDGQRYKGAVIQLLVMSATIYDDIWYPAPEYHTTKMAFVELLDKIFQFYLVHDSDYIIFFKSTWIILVLTRQHKDNTYYWCLFRIFSSGTIFYIRHFV